MRKRDALRSIRRLTGLPVADTSASAEAVILRLDDGRSVGLRVTWFDGSRASVAAMNDALRSSSKDPLAPFVDAQAVGRLRRALAEFASLPDDPGAGPSPRRLDPILLREAVRVAGLIRQSERFPGWSFRPEPVGSCPRCGEPSRIVNPSGEAEHAECEGIAPHEGGVDGL
jgi:hypothetical protein